MSLVPFALRVCATRALQAALPASVVVVVDSPQEPLDLLDKAAPQPIVAVYTGVAITKLEGRNLLGGAPVVLLTLQMFLPESFPFEASPGHTVTVDTRRQGAETALDILWRDTLLALNASPEPWAALWREFAPVVASIANQHYLLERNGVKVTAREVTIECEPIHEPVPGGEPADAWAAFVTLMRTDTRGDGLSALADWVEASIRDAALSPAGRDAAYLGLSAYVAQAIHIEDGIGSADPCDPREPLIEIAAEATS
jgi:hypothetical protein